MHQLGRWIDSHDDYDLFGDLPSYEPGYNAITEARQILKSKDYNDTRVFPVGKYRGQRVCDVIKFDSSYVDWAKGTILK